jgi:hypothetical protein
VQKGTIIREGVGPATQYRLPHASHLRQSNTAVTPSSPGRALVWSAATQSLRQMLMAPLGTRAPGGATGRWLAR